MINEERVKELYQMAVYDEYEDKECHQMGQYYIWDYVGKELVKSFFSGTIAFMLLVALWGIGDMSAAIAFVNSADLTNLAVRFILLYVGFMAIYLSCDGICLCRQVCERQEGNPQVCRTSEKSTEDVSQRRKIKSIGEAL